MANREPYIMLARRVTSLEALPEPDRDCYEADPAGGFRLIPDLIPDVERMEAEIEAKEDEIERKGALLRRLTIASAIGEALDSLDVQPQRKRVALTYLASSLEFDVREERGEMVAYVASPFGEISVSSAVESWLSSPEGAGYRLLRPPQSDGLFAEMARSLRSIH